jgi:divalent metal cation (Fe/Co/Zn/Cd) transporter
MALITNHRVTVILSLFINVLFIAAKFVAFLFSHVNLFFADAVDSFVDLYVVFLILVFLRFNLNGKLTLLSMDLLVFCQWSSIIVFRIVILLDGVDDILFPQPRLEALLVIIVSSVSVGGSLLLAVLFVDEDDVVKFFVDEEEKKAKKSQKNKNKKKNKTCCRVLPMFAEAVDNLVTSVISLALGLLMYFGVLTEWIYLIDNVCNMLISLVMCVFASRGLWSLSDNYRHRSQEPLLIQADQQ